MLLLDVVAGMIDFSEIEIYFVFEVISWRYFIAPLDDSLILDGLQLVLLQHFSKNTFKPYFDLWVNSQLLIGLFVIDFIGNYQPLGFNNRKH